MSLFFLLGTVLDRQHALFIMKKTKQNKRVRTPFRMRKRQYIISTKALYYRYKAVVLFVQGLCTNCTWRLY